MQWFDRSGLLYSKKDDTGDALNGILNLAYYLSLKHKIQHHIDAGNYINKIFDGKDYWDGIERKGYASHDDMTAIVCLKNPKHPGKIPLKRYWFRPEVVLYAIWNGSEIAHFFIWILSIKLIFSCWRDYKAENGIRETDGKLLAWLICEQWHLPLTKKICHAGIKHHFGDIKEVFKIKFQDEDHPIRRAYED